MKLTSLALYLIYLNFEGKLGVQSPSILPLLQVGGMDRAEIVVEQQKGFVKALGNKSLEQNAELEREIREHWVRRNSMPA